MKDRCQILPRDALYYTCTIWDMAPGLSVTAELLVSHESSMSVRENSVELEEASTRKSAKTHAGNVFVTRDLDLLAPK